MNSLLLFLSRMTSGPRDIHIADARESLQYWTHQADDLPWHRRAARREAQERMSAARAALIGAHLARTRAGALAPRLVPMLDARGRSARAHVRSVAFASMRRTSFGRKVLTVAAGLTVAAVAIGSVTAVLAIHTFG